MSNKLLPMSCTERSSIYGENNNSRGREKEVRFHALVLVSNVIKVLSYQLCNTMYYRVKNTKDKGAKLMTPKVSSLYDFMDDIFVLGPLSFKGIYIMFTHPFCFNFLQCNILCFL